MGVELTLPKNKIAEKYMKKSDKFDTFSEKFKYRFANGEYLNSMMM
jgi:hypothetical protein